MFSLLFSHLDEIAYLPPLNPPPPSPSPPLETPVVSVAAVSPRRPALANTGALRGTLQPATPSVPTIERSTGQIPVSVTDRPWHVNPLAKGLHKFERASSADIFKKHCIEDKMKVKKRQKRKDRAKGGAKDKPSSIDSASGDPADAGKGNTADKSMSTDTTDEDNVGADWQVVHETEGGIEVKEEDGFLVVGDEV